MRKRRTKANFKLFPPEGFWEITWLGPLSYRPGKGQFKIGLVVSERQSHDGGLADGYTGRVVLRNCGVGELVHVTVGSVANNGRLLPENEVRDARPSDQNDVTFVNVIRDRREPSLALDEGISLSAVPPSWIGPYRETPCAVLWDRSEKKRRFVQQIELIRALFGRSPDFLKAVLQGTLCVDSRPSKAIFYIDRSFVDPDDPKRAFIVAGRNLKDAEAEMAAFLLARRELWEAVKTIPAYFRSRGIQKGVPLFPMVDWPVFHVDNIHAVTRKVTFEASAPADDAPQDESNLRPSGEIEVITTIRGIDFEPPFNEVVVLYPVHDCQRGAFGVKRFHLKEMKPETIDIQDDVDPSLTEGGRVVLESPLIADNLRSLAAMTIIRRCIPKNVGQVTVVIPGQRNSEMVGSTADPGFGNGDVAVVDFIPSDDGIPQTNPETCPRLLAAAEATEILALELGGQAYEVLPDGDADVTVPPKCITFPTEYGGEDLPWSFYDDQLGWVRRAFVGLIVVGNVYLYLIDAEINRDESSSTGRSSEASKLLLLRLDPRSRLEFFQIRKILVALSKNRGQWGKVDNLPGPFEHVIHSNKRLNGRGMAGEIRGRLSKLLPRSES